MIALAVLGFGLGCRVEPTESFVGRFRQLAVAGETNGRGNLTLDVRPLPGETAMLVTAWSGDLDRLSHLGGLELRGDTLYSSTEETESLRARSNAAFLAPVATLNWPISDEDAPLEPDGRYALRFRLTDLDLEATRGPLELTALLKADDDLTAGTLTLDVVFFGSLADDEPIKQLTRTALTRSTALYASAGITLEIAERDFPSATAPLIAAADPTWTAIAESGPLDAIHLVVMPEGEGLSGIGGVSGDIPGPLVPGPQSSVHVIPERLCGPDGTCSAAETAMYGEVIAHEIGHYLGLFHPVELDFDQWDAIADTPECDRQSDCESLLASQLMFPYPVCFAGSCVPQEEITDGQASVLHRHVGVD